MKNRTVTAVALMLALAGCSGQKKTGEVEAASKKPDPIAVRLATAQARQVDETISVTGSLTPDETVAVSAEVSGRIASIRVDFGQQVKKGDVIAQLDTRELQLQLDRSKAALAQGLARIGLDPNQENIEPDSTPAIRQATAQMEDARSKFESAAKLVKTGDVSRERYNEVEKAFHARRAALEATRDDLRTQLASIQALRADVRLAQKRLADATVYAPFDGAVAQRLVSPGQYVKENTPMVTLVKSWPMRLRVDIPENATGAVRIGTSLTFTTDAASGTEFHATVRELNPALDARSRTLAAEARIHETDQRLRPGMFVQVRLVTQRNSGIVVVPKQAFYSVAGLTKLFMVKDGKATEVKVPPAREFPDGWVEAMSDQVRPGDQVAVSNLGQLYTGLEVKPRS